MIEKYNNLHLRTDRIGEHAFEYVHFVTANFAAHVAFRTDEGLQRWLDKTGLKVDDSPTAVNYLGYTKLVGSYTLNCIWEPSEFWKMVGSGKYRATDIIENGEVTLGLIEETPDGNVIYHLNCNQGRVILPYYHD